MLDGVGWPANIYNAATGATGGSRIIPQLAWLFRYDDKGRFSETFMKNAATALGKISSEKGLEVLEKLASASPNARVRNRAVKGIEAMSNGLSENYFDAAYKFLVLRLEREDSELVLKSLQKAIAIYRPRPDLRQVNSGNPAGPEPCGAGAYR